MVTYRVETIVAPGGTITLKGVPFRAGEKVEVIILSRKPRRAEASRYPLRGKPVRYQAPFESVAEEDWEALQ